MKLYVTFCDVQICCYEKKKIKMKSSARTNYYKAPFDNFKDEGVMK